VFWFVTYGPAYWENFEVKRVLKEAANLSYREHDDGRIREYVFRELHHLFDHKVEDHGRILTEMRIDVDDGDLRIERTQIPASSTSGSLTRGTSRCRCSTSSGASPSTSTRSRTSRR